MLVSSRTLPIAVIDVFAAFLDVPRKLVGFLIRQTARGAAQRSPPLLPAGGMQPVDVVRGAFQPTRGFEFFEDRVEIHSSKLLSCGDPRSRLNHFP